MCVWTWWSLLHLSFLMLWGVTETKNTDTPVITTDTSPYKFTLQESNEKANVYVLAPPLRLNHWRNVAGGNWSSPSWWDNTSTHTPLQIRRRCEVINRTHGCICQEVTGNNIFTAKRKLAWSEQHEWFPKVAHYPGTCCMHSHSRGLHFCLHTVVTATRVSVQLRSTHAAASYDTLTFCVLLHQASTRPAWMNHHHIITTTPLSVAETQKKKQKKIK